MSTPSSDSNISGVIFGLGVISLIAAVAIGFGCVFVGLVLLPAAVSAGVSGCLLIAVSSALDLLADVVRQTAASAETQRAILRQLRSGEVADIAQRADADEEAAASELLGLFDATEMTTSVACEFCAARLRVPIGTVAKVGKCPKCGKAVQLR